MVLLMMLANLRGLKESGALFAPPTYLYIVMLILLIVVGLYRIFFQDLGPIDVEALVANGELSPEALELSEGTAALEPADAAAGVLVRRGRAVRRRGGVERRARVPQARAPERGDDDRRSWA